MNMTEPHGIIQYNLINVPGAYNFGWQRNMRLIKYVPFL